MSSNEIDAVLRATGTELGEIEKSALTFIGNNKPKKDSKQLSEGTKEGQLTAAQI